MRFMYLVHMSDSGVRRSENESERRLLDGGESEIQRRVRDDRGFFTILNSLQRQI
jgi:hypothetical protein